jgi:hypothetical protein
MMTEDEQRKLRNYKEALAVVKTKLVREALRDPLLTIHFPTIIEALNECIERLADKAG